MTVNSLTSCRLWTALISPLTPEGIDTQSLKYLLEAQNTAQNGVLLLGSTGEGSTLSLPDRKSLIETAITVPSAYPYLVGITDMVLPHLLEWISYLNTKKEIGAYLLALPPYMRPALEGQYTWIKTVLDHAKKPIMLYNHPGRVGVSIDMQVIHRLKDHPLLWALKDATGRGEIVKKYHEAAPNLTIYAGDDSALPDYTQHGALGLISVCSNILPKELHTYTYAQFSATDTPPTASTFLEFFDTVNAMGPNPISVKGIMHALGLIAHDEMRLPLSPKDFHSHKLPHLKSLIHHLQKEI